MAPVDKYTVTLTENDCVEIYHILKSRGSSALRAKLEIALAALSPYLAKQLEKHESQGQTSK